MKVTVVKGKGAVTVLSWGGPPFLRVEEKRNNQQTTCYIPNGFTVLSIADYREWIGETRTINGFAEFSFRLYAKGKPRDQLCWCNKPSAAYYEANMQVRNKHFTKGNNGRLILGLFYQPIQTKLLEVFGKQTMHEQLYNPSVNYPADSVPILMAHNPPTRRRKKKGKKRRFTQTVLISDTANAEHPNSNEKKLAAPKKQRKSIEKVLNDNIMDPKRQSMNVTNLTLRKEKNLNELIDEISLVQQKNEEELALEIEELLDI